MAQARGAAPVGSAQYTVPAGALFVSPTGSDSAAGSQSDPFRTLAAALTKVSTGGTIVLRAGTYHESVTVTTPGVTVQAFPGEAVWFDGTSAVGDWRASGATWVHDGWTAQFDHSASFTAGQNQASFLGAQNPMAAWPDAVWVDGTQLTQVASASAVTAGTFFVDYAARRLVLGNDPAGRDVRASDLPQAFKVLAPNVTLQGFGVRRYATALPTLGTVRLQGGNGTVRDLVVVDNATQGISFREAGNLADHVTSSNNGMVGLHANGADRLTVRNSILSGNNAQRFNTSPSAAGIKVTRCRGLVFDNNTFADNNANGLWLDQSNVGYQITNNTFSNNWIGAQIELSDSGVVANNVFDGGKYNLYVVSSGEMKVWNNSFTRSTTGALWMWQDRRRQANESDWNVDGDKRFAPGDPANPWLLRNITVSNNAFVRSSVTTSFQIWAQDKATNIPADNMNVMIAGNRFAERRSSADATLVAWGLGDNKTLVRYDSVDALAKKNAAWVNAADTQNQALSTATSVALALPVDVAGLIGRPAGTKVIGPIGG